MSKKMKLEMKNLKTKVKKLRLVGSIAVIAMAFACIHSPGPTANEKEKSKIAGTGKIEVDVANILGPVNPLIFGNNLMAANSKNIFDTENIPYGISGDGVWDHQKRVPEPVALQLAKDVGIKIMRFPGGCLVHNYDWKKAVGPVEHRPDFAFGIDEFIEYCRALEAEPLMNVALYTGDAKDKADLVEYLNAPAESEYPWAMKRAAWGHTEPFHVKYFEMGNEEDHGNHNLKPHQRYTPEQYSAWFNECARWMKKTDPSIKMGAHMGTGTGPYDPWNKTVLSMVKETADFICVHTYAVGADNMNDVSDIQVRACMASGDDLEEVLSEYRRIISENAGWNIPVAVTEYNAGFPHTNPSPYAGALFSADYLRVLLNPQNNVIMANYWRYGGFWGLILDPDGRSKYGGETLAWKKMPGYYLYRLWAKHFGSRLTETKVTAPKLEFEGYLRTRPRGNDSQSNFIDDPRITLVNSSIGGGRTTVNGQAITLELKNYTGINHSSAMHFSNGMELATLDASPSTLYRCTFKARTRGQSGSYRFGIKIGDSRGWSATRHVVPVAGIEVAKEWTEFTGEITTLPDCSGLTISWWLAGQSPVPVNATIEVKDVKFERLPPRPSYSALTATASLSQDGKNLYLIVFNKHSEKDLETDVKINHASVASARVWQVNGPNLSAHNGQEELVNEVISGEAVPCFADGFTYTFPAHSMTAFNLSLE